MNPKGTIISVLGGKGGVGKSVIAANLAAAASLELKQAILLLDLDPLSCGDQNIITGLRPQKTFLDLTKSEAQINPTTLATFISRHPTGFAFIGSVRNPGETFSISPELISRTLDQLSQFFNYIIVDLGSSVSANQLAVIEKSTVLLTVTTAEILAVTQTGRLINDLMTAMVPSDLIQIVVNKASANGLTPQSIGQTLRKNVVGVIPTDEVTAVNALQRNALFVQAQASAPISQAHHEIIRRLITGGILSKLQAIAKPKINPLKSPAPAPVEGIRTAGSSKAADPRTILKTRIHTALITAMDLKKGITDTKGDPAKEQNLRLKTQQTISQILDVEQPGLGRDDRAQIIKEVLDEALGLGPLEDLLAQDSISEIMVNGPDRIFIEKGGKVQLAPVTFTSNLQLRNVIERIVTPLGRRIDEKTPYVDARLKDGSRVNAVIEPLSIDGPALTIRKFAKKPITTQNYVEWGSMTQTMVDFLRICVENALNVIVSGGTGSGKTTLLNVLSSFIPATARVITVEDAAELQLKQEHVVRLETRPANMEGTGAITIRDLVRNTLRMRPDRIVVGECRGGEALDMLSAMNTGHDGSMTTVHANSPREAIGRLETLCLMAGMDLPAKAIREQIAGAVDLIIQISRLSDGSRKILSITEVVGMQGESVTLQEIFRFKEEGFDKNRKIVGQFQAMGLIPSFIEEFDRKGISIPRSLFTTNSNPSQGSAAANNNLPPIKKAGGSR